MLSLGRGTLAGGAFVAAVFLVPIHASFSEAQAPADPPACLGKPVTIQGTDDSEVLTGTPGRDVISGAAGADVISGIGSADRICGGDGDDFVTGGLGSDRILGGGGDDIISGETGGDLIRGGPGSDSIRAGRGNDRVDGGPGDGDLVFGDLGDDRVRGGVGDHDQAAGGLGIDDVSGGSGDGDLVSGDFGYDRMSGGAGTGDIASFASAIAGPDGHGVTASLRTGDATGDGIDHLFAFEDLEGSAFSDTLRGNGKANVIDAGPGDDRVFGGGGGDRLLGDQGSDICRGGTEEDCGKEPEIKAPAYVQVDASLAGGGGLAVVGFRDGGSQTVAFDALANDFTISSDGPIGIGPGCSRVGDGLKDVICHVDGVVRGLVADLGGGNDRLEVGGGVDVIDSVRVSGGEGNDFLIGGAGAELLEAGSGRDHLYGGGGSDGLIGGIPGADFLFGGPGGDLLAAGGGCIGGKLVGGAGRDNASFAETPAHPGLLNASLARGNAFITAIPSCHPVGLAKSNEDLEGSFDWDILIGDGGPNGLFGQPGRDRLYGRGGSDSIDSRDGERDFVISCGGGSNEVARRDPSDPGPRSC